VKARRRARPADPLAIARARAAEREAARDPGRWGLDRGSLSLAANTAVETRADLAGRIARARRRDLFDTLAARGALSPAAHAAARRLQGDIARLHRAPGGVAAYAPRIDRTRTDADFGEHRLRAGVRVEAALGLTGPASAVLLTALLEAAALGQASDWREIVARHAGERLADAQAAAVRAACENLAGAYAALDRGRIRKPRL
jgi:hypothetical protein